MPAGGSERRLSVLFSESIWRGAVRGFSGGSLEVAASARRSLEANGIALAGLRPCEDPGSDGTHLRGCAKLYLPTQGPPSERPFGFVLQLVRDGDGELCWTFLAFGPRHPRPGIRSVYERAHRQLHGSFPS